MWLLMEHTTFSEYLRRFLLDLVHFILGNNYVKCQEREGPIMALQNVVLLGATLNSNCATNFMIWLETSKIDECEQQFGSTRVSAAF